MTPQELRGSILSLAIQGKLTERLSEDGAARELLFDSVVENNVDGQRVKEKIITEKQEENCKCDCESHKKHKKKHKKKHHKDDES